MEAVDLEIAFQWRCPKCGERHFVEGETLGSADVGDEHFGMEGDYVAVPKCVLCEGCKTRYRARHGEEQTG